MAKKAPKKMAKRNFPSNKERARVDRYFRKNTYNLGLTKEDERRIADAGTAGLVPNKAGKKMQANKTLKTPQAGRDVPLPKSKF